MAETETISSPLKPLTDQLAELRRKLASQGRQVRAADRSLETYTNAFHLQWLLEQGGRKLEGTNESTRKLELADKLAHDDVHRRLRDAADQARDKQADLEDELDLTKREYENARLDQIEKLYRLRGQNHPSLKPDRPPQAPSIYQMADALTSDDPA